MHLQTEAHTGGVDRYHAAIFISDTFNANSTLFKSFGSIEREERDPSRRRVNNETATSRVDDILNFSLIYFHVLCLFFCLLPLLSFTSPRVSVFFFSSLSSRSSLLWDGGALAVFNVAKIITRPATALVSSLVNHRSGQEEKQSAPGSAMKMFLLYSSITFSWKLIYSVSQGLPQHRCYEREDTFFWDWFVLGTIYYVSLSHVFIICILLIKKHWQFLQNHSHMHLRCLITWFQTVRLHIRSARSTHVLLEQT